MSLAREDREEFCMLSGDAVLCGPGGERIPIPDVERGEWEACCEIDDYGVMKAFVAGTKRMMGELERSVETPNRMRKLDRISSEVEFESPLGMVCVFDRHFYGRMPKRLEFPKNPMVEERFGDPEDASKEEGVRFIEMAIHRSYRAPDMFPAVGSVDFGAFGGMSLGKARLKALIVRDPETLRADGIEVRRA